MLIFVFPLAGQGTAQNNSHAEAGLSASREYLDKFGNVENFESLIVNPMLGEGELTTTNGAKTFKAPMACGSHQPYAAITLSILGSGDLDFAALKLDSNGDGTMNQILSSLPRVSGVCANGYISCDPGTWNNCHYYQWANNANGRFTAQAVSVADVGACQCINNGCTPNYSSLNFETLLTQVGATVSQALTQQDYSLVTTKVDIAGPTITYFGQATSNCSGTNLLAPNYFNQPNDIDIAVETTLDTELSEAEIYHLARNSESASNMTEQTKIVSCQIKREATLDEVSLLDILSIGAGRATANLVNANTVDITVGEIGNNYLDPPGHCGTIEQSSEIAILRPERIVSAELQHVQYDDHVQVILNDSVVWNGPHGNWTNIHGNPPTGSCERETSNDLNAVSVDVLPHFPNTSGTLAARVRVRVGGQGEGYARIRVGVNTECKEGEDRVINQCQGYEQSPKCRLRDEIVDGVATVNQFARTGLASSAQTSVLHSPTCELNIIREWINIQRTYECENNHIDFETAAARVHTIESSTTETRYTDLRPTNAETVPVEIPGELSVFDEIPVERCTLQCKVKREKFANDVTVSGLTSEELAENQASEIVFRECINNHCQLSDNEEILQDCGCINGFNDVALMMQLIRMAGSDMICSSGQRQAL